jgi:hypothetical protein
MRAITIDVYNESGDLTKIVANDAAGDHIADFQWDPTDEQTSENRVKFRAWVYRFLEENKGYEVPR